MSLNTHKILYLYKTPSRFFIQPVERPQEALVIDRVDEVSSAKVLDKFSVNQLPTSTTSSLIYGIIGVKTLPSRAVVRSFDRYLIVITKATQIGVINNEPIYRMDQAQVIPIDVEALDKSVNISRSREDSIDWSSIIVSMLESVLQTPSFYFSYSYDLTNSLQRIYQKKEAANASLTYDKRFLWNQHLISESLNNSIPSSYRLPFIHGFISIDKSVLGRLKCILISRRSVNRAGTRFIKRGADEDGNAANFVENEQILEDSGTLKTSFVQVRGSIPLLWSQNTNYKYKPAIGIDLYGDQDIVIKKHFEELRSFYNNVSVVNLIDSVGHEERLASEFRDRIHDLQSHIKIPYHYFDFHKECSKMRWYRLSILIDSIRGEIESYGYFAVANNQVIQQQNGVIRTNCIDSLDRTNVVQNMIAQVILESQLRRFGLVPTDLRIEQSYDLMAFKNIWADNADALSVQYAGTSALKTDFTRTGQRTYLGMLNDGVNSLTRYVSNNFFDAYRQDAIDEFLGKMSKNWDGHRIVRLYKPMDLSQLPTLLVVLTFIVLYIYTRY